jgi:hypothetical protein
MSPWAAIPIQKIALNADLHNLVVLLKLHDENESEFDFALEPDGARKLAKSLLEWAQRVDDAPKTSKQ